MTGMNTKSKHIGSDFDDFLKEEHILEQTEAAAIKRVIVHQIQAATKHLNLTKAAMAKKMHTSRSELDRLLDPENDSVTLITLNRAASALGKKLKVQLV
jgi:antitoxin HicB